MNAKFYTAQPLDENNTDFIAAISSFVTSGMEEAFSEGSGLASRTISAVGIGGAGGELLSQALNVTVMPLDF
jgi:hypothetical protein